MPKKPIVGKFILDSVSIGMYNHPLMLFREYIQNSTDAIDELYDGRNGLRKKAKIDINIDGRNRSIAIKDDGCGISSSKAWNILHDIGRSSKKLNVSRGFRGIGRLGGLAYCDELKFITKAKGEDIYSISTWDCKKLRKLINEENKLLDAAAIVRKIVTFSQCKYEGNIKDHYFIVEMRHVHSSRDVLMNVPHVKAYISQIAPVPFDHSEFSYADKIETRMRQQLPSYATYNIYVNGEKILKPYADSVIIHKKRVDQVRDIKFVNFVNDGEKLAFGWVGRLELLGIVNRSSCVDGLRVRSGNILVSDKDLMSGFFREKRFNNYLIGEIHVVNPSLILNSRRDDFEDNNYKEQFCSCFVKEIGIPFSREIREASKNRSRESSYKKQGDIIEAAKKISEIGYLSNLQRERVISELKHIKSIEQDNVNKGKIDLLISKVNNSKHYFDQNHKKLPKETKALLTSIFDIIHNECRDRKELENIIRNINSILHEK